MWVTLSISAWSDSTGQGELVIEFVIAVGPIDSWRCEVRSSFTLKDHEGFSGKIMTLNGGWQTLEFSTTERNNTWKTGVELGNIQEVAELETGRKNCFPWHFTVAALAFTKVDPLTVSKL